MSATHPSVKAAELPGKEAVIMAFSGRSLTYADLVTDSQRIAQLYRSAGLGIGSTVAAVLENHVQYLSCYWAAQRSGVYFVPISTRLTAREVSQIVADSGAKLLITSIAMSEIARTLGSATPTLTHRFMLDGVIPGYESFEEAVAARPAKALSDETEGRIMFYSSGTTGRPKGVRGRLSGAPIATPSPALQAYATQYAMDRSSICLTPAPLYHAAPLIFSVTVHACGGTSIVMEKFDPEAVLRFIERYRITHVNLVPTMFVRLLRLPEKVRLGYDLSSLRMVIHGAAPCPVAIKERMIEWLGPTLCEYYAASEGSVFCCITSHEWMTHKGSVGKPILGPVHILDSDGNELPPGSPGEVWSAYPADFVYHNDPAKTAEARNSRGWTTLGDIGYLDEEGYLYLTDRKAFTIISGGVNVYPQEAENVLLQHPSVVEAAVFGVPDEDLGEAVKAVVQPVNLDQAGPELETELIAFCREHLSPIKCPRSIDFEAALPRHDNGKLYKLHLKNRYWRSKSSA